MPGSQFVSSGEALAEIWWTAEVQRSTLTGGTKHGLVLWSWKGLEQALKIDELFHPFQPQPNTPRKQVWNQHENIRGQKSILRILRNPVWTWNRMWDTHRVLANAMPVIHKIANSQLFMTCEIGWNREVFDAVFKTSEALLSVISVMVVESIQDHQLPCASRVARATRHQYHLSSMVQMDQMAGSGCNCGMQIAQWFLSRGPHVWENEYVSFMFRVPGICFLTSKLAARDSVDVAWMKQCNYPTLASKDLLPLFLSWLLKASFISQ